MKSAKLVMIMFCIVLTGCGKAQGGVGNALTDHFNFTPSQKVPESGSRCITLTKAVVVPSSYLANCTLPKGKYIARKENGTGAFYYAPTAVSYNMLLSSAVEGIYLDNQMKQGTVFFSDPYSYDGRPIRGVALPGTIFKYIKRSC